MDTNDYADLSQRVVLVTGGGSGLGASICALLAGEGARVVTVDINERAARTVADDIVLQGGDALAVKADVGSQEDIRNMLDQAAARFGRLDAIVNNAGVDVTQGVDEMAVAEWNRIIATNLTGPFMLVKFGLSYLAPGGHIVNIASTAARRAWRR